MPARSPAPGINRLSNAMKKVPALVAVAEMATGCGIAFLPKINLDRKKATLN
jgi:hypothetical protein